MLKLKQLTATKSAHHSPTMLCYVNFELAISALSSSLQARQSSDFRFEVHSSL